MTFALAVCIRKRDLWVTDTQDLSDFKRRRPRQRNFGGGTGQTSIVWSAKKLGRAPTMNDLGGGRKCRDWKTSPKDNLFSTKLEEAIN